MTIKTIKPSGGDFTTLSAWEASLAATLTVPQQADLYNFGSSGLVEASGVVFSGFTTTSVNRIILNVPSGQRHNGTAHSGAYVTNGAGSVFDTIRLGANVDYFTIDWMEIEAVASRSALNWCATITAGSNQQLCQHSILHSNGQTLGVTNTSGANYIYRNNFIYTNSNTRMFDNRNCASCELSNCTFYGQGVDYNVIADAATVIKNCYSGGATTQCFFTGNGATGSFNCSSDTSATALGASSINSQAGSAVLVSATAGSEDLRMKTGSNALFDAGTTIAAVTDDILGTTRPQSTAYDIGGFERVVSSGITATGAWTETQDAWAGSVTLTFPTITANAAWTESRDLWAITGSVKIDGAAAWTEARDVWVGSATISAAGIAATGAWIETQDIWAGVATVALPAITVNGAWTEAQDIWNGSGGPPVTVIIDDGHDGENRRKKKFGQDREQRERRRREVREAFERVVEGRVDAPVAEEVVDEVLREIAAVPVLDTAAFQARLDAAVQTAYRAYLERDDEEVLALL